MIEPFFTPSDALVCHVRTHHVEPINCVTDWRMEPDAEEETRTRLRLAAGELLLIGREPRIENVRGEHEREQLEQLLADGLRLKTKVLMAAPETHVSATQVAIWFARGELMVASVGRNMVEVQRWGRGRAMLARLPGAAIGQLATLWLPLTESSGGSNMRWRVSLAFTGPEELIRDGIETSDRARTRGTGVAASAGIVLSPSQRNVVVERFAQWLSFPAVTFDPRMQTISGRRAGEPGSNGQKASKRRDTRMERFDGLLARLERLGYSGRIDQDFIRALVEHGAIVPADVHEFDELDLNLLVELGLLPRACG